MIAELIKRNRSIRRFDASKDVDYSTLSDILDKIRFTHSARNQQALVFRIVSEKHRNDRIFPLLRWAAYLKDWNGPAEQERPNAYIIVGLDTSRGSIADKWVFVDLGIVLQSISLLLAEKNLASCIIAAFDKEKLIDIEKIPSHIEPLIVMAIGHANEKVEIIEIESTDDIKYFRKNNIHYVPKRKLKDIIF